MKILLLYSKSLTILKVFFLSICFFAAYVQTCVGGGGGVNIDGNMIYSKNGQTGGSWNMKQPGDVPNW